VKGRPRDLRLTLPRIPCRRAAWPAPRRSRADRSAGAGARM